MILQAGPLSVLYENGFLRYVRHGNEEIIRMIYFAVRDENWGTCNISITHERIKNTASSFEITYACTSIMGNEPVMAWNVSLQGKADGSISFDIDGLVLKDFLKNRAGFCVLHPIIETAGHKVEITHSDNSTTTSVFPEIIAPNNPFKDIAKLKWQYKNTWAVLEFEGEGFETEDQRNWTDASFKTFCTPLDLPTPVQLTGGQRIKQQIKFSTETQLDISATSTKISIIKGNKSIPFPLIGVTASNTSEPFSNEAISNIQRIGFDHYRIELDPSDERWIEIFSNYCYEAATLNLPLQVAIHLTENFQEELEMFSVLFKQNRLNIQSLILLSRKKNITDQKIIDFALCNKELFDNIKIGAGTNYNYTEINRNRRNMEGVDFISYGIHPQEHAFDDTSIIENIQGQAESVKSARSIYNCNVAITPISLKKRFNPYTANTEKVVIPIEDQVDERLQQPFAATWTLGSIKQIIEAGGNSMTYFQSHGLLGIQSANGKTFPVYEYLSLVLKNKFEITSCHSTHPLIADALLYTNGNALFWNYTNENIEVHHANINVKLNAYEIKFLKL